MSGAAGHSAVSFCFLSLVFSYVSDSTAAILFSTILFFVPSKWPFSAGMYCVRMHSAAEIDKKVVFHFPSNTGYQCL